MTFEAYLISKKIDQQSFQKFEPQLFESWKSEFEQVSPNSFTSQKLYLINPIRRKYILKQEPVKIVPTENNTVKEITDLVNAPPLAIEQPSTEVKSADAETPASSTPKPARPVFKPKPKIN